MTKPSRPSSSAAQVPASSVDGRPAAPAASRLVSLDAYRGEIMLLMASAGLGLPKVAESFPDRPWLRFVGRQCEHAEWAGCTLWDLIQPSFMFMVGVALPWSIASRRARGHSDGGLFLHAVWRAVVLVLLAVFLTSAWSPRTEWIFPNVLAQIGLGYPVLFLAALAPPRVGWWMAGGLLAGCWLVFALHPLPPPDFDWSLVGVTTDWPHLKGFAAHWDKNANAAASFDRWFLNLFPRATPFTFNAGGYQTLNFVPSIATMIFGLQAGRLLRDDVPRSVKLGRLLWVGAAGIAAGWVLDRTGICPSVKRIWTPSWALFSGGWSAWLLAGFVAAVDGRGSKAPRWVYPLVVAGTNPITLYCLWQLSGSFIKENLRRHVGPHVFDAWGPAWVPFFERGSILLVLWLVLFWMHRRRIFISV